ncbi:uncharacterized protein LOC143286555 isoform X2 [Babylonia areolata]|uniref:uncharacterized protein LOC143286555 isoform X2 n=1 Tax=Babylonia areolata TaxID=304850 RepID=UPI003FD363E0
MFGAAVLLAVVLSAMLVQDTGADSFKQSGLSRHARSSSSVLSHALSACDCSAEEILHKYGCSEEGAKHIPPETYKSIYDKSDVNEDDKLNEKEKLMFELRKLAEIVEVCIESAYDYEGDDEGGHDYGNAKKGHGTD